MVGDLDVALDVFLAGSDIGKHCGKKIVRPNAQNLWRDFLPISVTKKCQRAPSVPTPSRLEDGGGKSRLFQHFLHIFFAQKLEDVSQGKAVLLGESNV